MNISIAETVIPTPFMEDTRSVRLHFDFEDQQRQMTPDEFWEFCSRNRKLRAELTKDGDVIIMAPTGFESSKLNLEILLQLGKWARRDKTGTVTESNGAYILPNGATYAPDAAWIKSERLEPFSDEEKQRFLPLCPDFVIELRSSSDSLSKLRLKMDEWIENGARLAWLVDPFQKKVYIYRPGSEQQISDDPASISGEDVLPGFELDLTKVW